MEVPCTTCGEPRIYKLRLVPRRRGRSLVCLSCRSKVHAKKYYRGNRENVLAKQRAARQTSDTHRVIEIKWRVRQKQKALAALGGVCKRCGFSDSRALQIDHIAGNGYQERKRSLITRYTQIINSVSPASLGYQLLCANCNWIKRVENEEHVRRGSRRNL